MFTAFYWIRNLLLFFLVLYTIFLIRDNKKNINIKLERKKSIIILFSLAIILSLMELSVPFFYNGISVIKSWILTISEKKSFHNPFGVIMVICYVALNLLVLIGYLRFKTMRGLKLLYGTVVVIAIDSILSLIPTLVALIRNLSILGPGYLMSISFYIISITSGVIFFFHLSNNGLINRKSKINNLKVLNNKIGTQSENISINTGKHTKKNRHYIIMTTFIYIVEFILLMITLYGSYFKTISEHNEYLSIYTQNYSTLFITVLYLLFYGYLVLFIILCNTTKLIKSIVYTVKSSFTVVLIVLLLVEMSYINDGLNELLTINFDVAFYSHILLIILSILPILVIVPRLEPLVQE
ncbi:hypothetical protein RJG79_08025 [Mycoplasmatota bacterium WC44]